MTQAVHEALTLFDAAQGRIQEFVRKVTAKPSDQGSGPEPAKPKSVVKKVRPIKAAALVKTTYLETREEVEEFLDSLKQELDDALARGERIQIR
jgi:hypothetical protein